RCHDPLVHRSLPVVQCPHQGAASVDRPMARLPRLRVPLRRPAASAGRRRSRAGRRGAVGPLRHDHGTALTNKRYRQFVFDRDASVAVARATFSAARPPEQTMQTLGLNIVELLDLVRVCGSLQVDKCTASFLSDYLAAGLAVLDPELAVKVRRFDEDELEA